MQESLPRLALHLAQAKPAPGVTPPSRLPAGRRQTGDKGLDGVNLRACGKDYDSPLESGQDACFLFRVVKLLAVTSASAKACCKLRRELADQFAIAARLYAEAVVIFTHNEFHGPQFEELRERAREAQDHSEKARVAFEEHVASHGC